MNNIAKLMVMAAAFCASAENVQYRDPIDPDNPEKSADCAAITDSTTMLSAGWYVVDATVNNANRIAVSGDVNIVLRGVLHADKGFHVTGGDSLTVWKAVEGGGEVYVEDADDNCAGIGGDDGQSCGIVTVNGGNIYAEGYKCPGVRFDDPSGGPGIYVKKLVINGGSVEAAGGWHAAGIGGGEGKSGETVMKVPLERTDKMIQRNGKQIKRILVCHTEGECFPVMANKFTTTDTNAHFLVGKVAGDPEVLGENGNKDSLKNSGLYQFIDLDNDAGAYSNASIDGDKANVDAVVIMLVGDATSAPTSYQMDVLDKLIVHIRTKADNFDIPVVSPNSFDFPQNPRALMPNFSADDYNE